MTARSPRRTTLHLLTPFVWASLLLGAPPAEAQQQDPAGSVLEGEVTRGGEPVPGTSVDLHRVAPGFAGQIDSTRTGTEGSFRFQLPTLPSSDPDSGTVYFASVRHHDVLYFGRALNQAAQVDSLYRIEVHDTTAAPPRGAVFPIVARNLLLEEADSGWTVVDLFRIQNGSDRTVVAREGGVVWSHPLPPSARNFEPGESDLAPDAVTFEDGAIRVSSPVPPGERTYLMRYSVPAIPFTIPVAEATERLEMLVREPAPPLTVSGLQQLEPVQIEPESNYRRFAGAELEGSSVEVTEGEEGGPGEVAWYAIVLGLVLAAGGIYALQRQPRAAAAERAPTRNELLLRIAQLDDAFQGAKDLPAEERERYRAERKRLKIRLKELEG